MDDCKDYDNTSLIHNIYSICRYDKILMFYSIDYFSNFGDADSNLSENIFNRHG